MVAMPLYFLMNVLALGLVPGQNSVAADCARPVDGFEEAICSEPMLARLEQDMAERYAAAREPLSPAARGWLQADQALFFEARKGWREARHVLRAEPLGPGYWTRRRIALLEQVHPARDAAFSGFWQNVSGVVVVSDNLDGSFTVEVEASQPVGRHWQCSLDFTARVERGVLETVLDEEETGPERWRIRAVVTDGVLKLTESPVAGRGGERPPYCGAGGHIDGIYFRTGD